MRGSSDLYNATKIWEAGRATSAASSFFDPIAIGPLGQEFTDGGTGANNPIRHLWNEAQEVFCDGSYSRLLKNIRVVVSVGTGVPNLKEFGNDPLAIGKTLMDISTETEVTANGFHQTNSDLDDEGRYYRFNVDKGLAEIGLDKADEIKRVKDLTDEFLKLQTNQSAIKKCAVKMGEPIISVLQTAAPSTYS